MNVEEIRRGLLEAAASDPRFDREACPPPENLRELAGYCYELTDQEAGELANVIGDFFMRLVARHEGH